MTAQGGGHYGPLLTKREEADRQRRREEPDYSWVRPRAAEPYVPVMPWHY